MSRLALAVLVSVLAGGTSGCVSPTLPLPPPDAPTSVTLDTSVATPAGSSPRWIVRGASTAGAVVLVRNAATGRIFGVEDVNFDGRYTLSIEAHACDLAEVWELDGDVTSERTGFLVAPTTNGVTDDSACQ